MKCKLILNVGVLAIALFLATSFASAQKTNAIKLNYLSPLVKTLNLQYEHVLSPKTSGQLGFFYTGYSASDTKFSGFGLTPEFRFYPAGSALNGFFLAPFLRYQNFKLTDEISTGTATFSSFGGGFTVGYQALVGDLVTFEGFIGPSYSSGSVSGTGSYSVSVFDGFGIRAGVTVGFAF